MQARTTSPSSDELNRSMPSSPSTAPSSPAFDPRDPPSPTPSTHRQPLFPRRHRTAAHDSPVNKVLPPIDPRRPRRVVSPASSTRSRDSLPSFGVEPGRFVNGQFVKEGVEQDVRTMIGQDDGPEDFTQNMEYWMRCSTLPERMGEQPGISEGPQPNKDSAYPPPPTVEDDRDDAFSSDSTFSPVETSNSPRPLQKAVESRHAQDSQSTNLKMDDQSQLQVLREQIEAITRDRDDLQEHGRKSEVEAAAMVDKVETAQRKSRVLETERHALQEEVQQCRAEMASMAQKFEAQETERRAIIRELEVSKAETALMHKEAKLTARQCEEECASIRQELAMKVDQMEEGARLAARKHHEERDSLSADLGVARTQSSIMSREVKTMSQQHDEERKAWLETLEQSSAGRDSAGQEVNAFPMGQHELLDVKIKLATDKITSIEAGLDQERRSMREEEHESSRAEMELLRAQFSEQLSEQKRRQDDEVTRLKTALKKLFRQLKAQRSNALMEKAAIEEDGEEQGERQGAVVTPKLELVQLRQSLASTQKELARCQSEHAQLHTEVVQPLEAQLAVLRKQQASLASESVAQRRLDESVNRDLEGRLVAAMQARERHWRQMLEDERVRVRKRDDLLRRERGESETMGKVLMLQWGKQEMGLATKTSSQPYRYRYVGR